MPLPSLRTAPLADRTRAALVDAIVDEVFADGRLPAEPELARQLGVSRTTLRSALDDLETLGLIDRTRGTGTLLLSHTGARVLGLSGLVSFTRLLAARGHRVTTRRSLGHDPEVPGHVTTRLGGGDPGPVAQLHTVLLADDVPAIATRARFRVTEIDGDIEDLEPPASILDLSATAFREPIDHAVADIVPVVAEHDGYESLDVAAGQPLLLLRETHHTAALRAVATSDVVIGPDHLSLSVFRRVPHDAG